MKNTLRIMSALFALVLCFGLLAACGNTGATTASDHDTVPSTGAVGTEPFVAPPDQIGKVVSADATLITWNAYASDNETIDFMGVDVKALGSAAGEKTLFYLEEDVTYYLIEEGKLVDAAVEDVVSGSVVGITTLEEGVQEVYILYVPAVDDGSYDSNDIHDESVEDAISEETTEAAEATPTEETTETSGQETESSFDESALDTESPDGENS